MGRKEGKEMEKRGEDIKGKGTGRKKDRRRTVKLRKDENKQVYFLNNAIPSLRPVSRPLLSLLPHPSISLLPHPSREEYGGGTKQGMKTFATLISLWPG